MSSACAPTLVVSEPVDPRIVEEVLENVQRVFRVKCPGYVEIVFHGTRPQGLEVEYETGLYHEAYDDYPRIHVVVEDYIVWPRSLRTSTVVHEAVHAVLHGRFEFYVASGDDPRLLHAALTTVKDLEVSLWMAKHGFREELGVLREYWDARVQGCGLLEEVMDEARRLAVYVALGVNPSWKCGRLSEKLYNTLVELARCKPRPWACRHRLVDLFMLLS